MRRIRSTLPLAVLAGVALAASVAPTSGSTAQTIHVGPNRAVKSIAEAARQAGDGDTVEVDAGTYAGDVAIWQQNNLTLRAVGGRVRLVANGAAAEGKGIWVVRGGHITIEGFDFAGARVRDRNGAGIRFERGLLTVRNCSFTHNEMGLLTNNDSRAELIIENSEFAHNSRTDGHNHNLYVGSIARLTVTGSYFHHAATGHLLKSRAALNRIMYNRLTDEAEGHASYELEFPDGGVAYVIGNLIGQSARTENPVLISFGAESYKWPANELYLVNNTLIDGRLYGGDFLRVKPGAVTVKAVNNLLVGMQQLQPVGASEYRNNFNVGVDEFESGLFGAYRLKPSSRLIGLAIDTGSINGQDLRPYSEYVHGKGAKTLNAPAHNPGAMQKTGRNTP